MGGVDGNFPWGTPAIGSDGELYGATQLGGVSGWGTVFELAPSGAGAWTGTVLYSFQCGADACQPHAGVAVGGNGSLYGAAPFGGSLGFGLIFELTPPAIPGGAWTENILYNFDITQAQPGFGTLLVGPGGSLYGSTTNVVYQLVPPAASPDPWRFKFLHVFNQASDVRDVPGGLTRGDGGTLFGSGYQGGGSGGGGVFQLQPPVSPPGPWAETILHTFNVRGGGGYNPNGSLVMGKNGVLYGTTGFGGASGYGAVFALKP